MREIPTIGYLRGRAVLYLCRTALQRHYEEVYRSPTLALPAAPLTVADAL